MLNSLAREIANACYLVSSRVRQFKKSFPEARVLAAGATRARKLQKDSPLQYEPGWITARRGVLILTETGLHCGDWTIPLNTIREATLSNVAGGSVLKIATADEQYYQFGLQQDPAWEQQKVLPLKIQKAELQFSTASVIMRLFVLAFSIASLLRGISL
ncbi:MAG: hypothetical protein F6K28_50545, partial [Microcoleus sp. SIO2G3]|nr:hypothetical protein [Microcoleus sp. SIO2G3]